MVHHKEFWEMHQQMKTWCERQERDGWQSPEVKKWATFVKSSLWTLAQNRFNPPVLVSALAEYMANLERAKSAHTSRVAH